MRKLILISNLLIAGVVFFGCKNDPTLSRDRRTNDPLMQNEERITEIISKMTLEEVTERLNEQEEEIKALKRGMLNASFSR